MWQKSFLKVCAATAAYAAIHSALASRTAKRTSEQVLGIRRRNALYRPFYLVQSAVTMGLLVAYIRRLHSVTLYDCGGLGWLVLRTGQGAGIAWAVYAAYEVGFVEILGIRGLGQLMRGEDAIPREPEAQGPAPGKDGRLRVRGPFALSRHPLNFAPLAVMWLNPRMTTNLLAFNALATVYLVLGSWHEEVRLRSAGGEEYRKYQESSVAFYLPGVRHRGEPIVGW